MLLNINIFGFAISTYILVVFISVLTCWGLILIRTSRLGFNPKDIYFMLLLGFPVGIFGAAFTNIAIKLTSGQIEKLEGPAGMTILGTIAFCLLFFYLYTKKVLKKSPGVMLDIVAFGFPYSIMIGRMACLLAGCCYGKVAPNVTKGSFLSLLTLTVGAYEETSPAGLHYHSSGMVEGALVWNLPLLLMLNCGVALFVCEYAYRQRTKWRLRPGMVMGITFACYSFGRFFVEFFREIKPVAGTIINPWQLTVLVVFTLSASFLVHQLYKRKQCAS